MKAIRSQNPSTASIKPSFAKAWEHSVGDISDIGVTFVGKFGRQRVCAKECRPDRDVALLRKLARDAERFALSVKVEPVAGFDFDRADALGDESVQSPQRRSEEFVFARGAGRADGGKNPAAFASDLFISGAGEPELEFVRPVAPVNKVGMAIDQGGRDPAAFAIDDARAVAPRRRKLVLRASEGNSPSARGDGA